VPKASTIGLRRVGLLEKSQPTTEDVMSEGSGGERRSPLPLGAAGTGRG